jgi:serine/threonine-protein phosphatase 2B regulatory subunit
MGCLASKYSGGTDDGDASYEKLNKRLSEQTHFRMGQISVLRSAFAKITAGNSKTINREMFQRALYGVQSAKTKKKDDDAKRDDVGGDLFSERIFALFDTRGDGTLSFEEFVTGLSVFHPDASKDEKTQFAFEVYDLRGTGAITREDVRRMLVAVLRQNATMTLTEEQTEQVLDKTFDDVDLSKDGVISLTEFKALVEKDEKIIANMTMPSLNRLTKEYPDFIFSGGAASR